MSAEEFTAFLTESLGLCADHSADGAIHFVFMDWRHMAELLAAGEAVYSELKNLCVWTKSNAGQGSFYRSQHELVFVFKHGTAPHLNTFELGQHGRNRSNVWPYAGVNSFRAGRLDELKLHPTVKPVALVVDAMRDCSRRGDIVLDAFAGSGTTILAAERIGRRAFCLELDPLYADVSIRRWQAYTKRDAILEGTGETFEELAAARSSKEPARRSGAAGTTGERAAELGAGRRKASPTPHDQDAQMKQRRTRWKGELNGDYEIGYGRPPRRHSSSLGRAAIRWARESGRAASVLPPTRRSRARLRSLISTAAVAPSGPRS